MGIDAVRGLNDLGVLVTRPVGQADGLCRAVRDAGGRPWLFPALEIRAGGDPARLQTIFQRLAEFRLAIFVSANAVAFSLPWFRCAGGVPDGMRLAAVGKATARALEERLAAPDLVPQAGFDSEALLALPELQQVAGQAVLILRGEGGRPLLGDTLTQRGAEVVYAELYRRDCPQADVSSLLASWDRIQVVIATSEELLENLLQLFGEAGRSALLGKTLLVISPRLATFAREQGFNEVLQAQDAGDEALLAALENYVQQTGAAAGRASAVAREGRR